MKHKIFLLILLVAVMLVCPASKKRTATLFMVGDSTMADKTELDASPERGWGQVFPTFLDSTRVQVQNHACNGRSTKSFIDEGRWNDVISRVHRGDVVLIQFGHNDEKSQDPKRYTNLIQYRANLTRMVTEVRAKGAQPVLATPVVRRKFDAEGYSVNSHGAYPEAVRTVARLEQVPLLDLTALSAAWLNELGVQGSKNYYMNVPADQWKKFPQGKEDNTHLQEAGALAIGKLAAQAIEQSQIKPLYLWLRKNANKTAVYTTPCGIRK